MTQKTLDGKTDCRGVRGTCTIKFAGKAGDNPEVQEILKGLHEVHKKYPCVKIVVNNKRLQEGDEQP